MIPYKPHVREKQVESILGTRENMTKKVFNLNNTIPHSVHLVNPYSNIELGEFKLVPYNIPQILHKTKLSAIYVGICKKILT
jgi:hypothetical protein